MKNTGVCPKCQSDNIVRIDGTTAPNYGNFMYTGYTLFSAVSVNRYICCNCGFTEEWIDQKMLAKVAGSKLAKR